MTDAISPEKILQTGMTFWASRTLLSAIEMGVFAALANDREAFETLRGRLGLHPRSARDLLDKLVALGFLRRDGDRAGHTAGSKRLGLARVEGDIRTSACNSLRVALRGGPRQPQAGFARRVGKPGPSSVPRRVTGKQGA